MHTFLQENQDILDALKVIFLKSEATLYLQMSGLPSVSYVKEQTRLSRFIINLDFCFFGGVFFLFLGPARGSNLAEPHPNPSTNPAGQS